jgi:hypothetical protein
MKARAGISVALPNKLILIAVSCLTSVLAVALHEHAGHRLAYFLSSRHPNEIGASMSIAAIAA